jgi:DNA-binding MarR family transcriptional regulator
MKLEEAIKSNRFTDERHKASLNVLYTAYWLKDTFSAALKEDGITAEQHNVLRILKGSHPTELCVKEIGARIIEKSSNVPRIVDRLVIKKLVKRVQSKEDKRETLVSLTEKGIATIDKLRVLMDNMTSMYVNLTDGEAEALNKLLEKMRESPPQ